MAETSFKDWALSLIGITPKMREDMNRPQKKLTPSEALMETAKMVDKQMGREQAEFEREEGGMTNAEMLAQTQYAVTQAGNLVKGDWKALKNTPVPESEMAHENQHIATQIANVAKGDMKGLVAAEEKEKARKEAAEEAIPGLIEGQTKQWKESITALKEASKNAPPQK